MGKKHKLPKKARKIKMLKKGTLHSVAYLTTAKELQTPQEHSLFAVARYIEQTGRRLEKGRATSEKEYDTFKEIAHDMLDFIRYFRPHQ